ncbi:MAG: lysostaphin resistance A-like protein, partial [Phycisphaerae bacterium]
RFMFGPGLRRDASSHVTADVHRGGRVALRVCALVVCATLVAVGVCPLVVSATRGAVAFFAPGYHFDPHATIQALRDDAVPAGLTVCLWLGAVVVAPIAEEVFFRGVVQTMLARMCRGRWSAIIGTAIVFGVIHVPQPDTVPAVTAFGVLLGYTYERTGAVAVPIVIHAGFNLTNLVAAGVA